MDYGVIDGLIDKKNLNKIEKKYREVCDEIDEYFGWDKVKVDEKVENVFIPVEEEEVVGKKKFKK